MVALTGKAPLRYYVYISDYKLDLLYEQISPALRTRISGELKIDLKVASLTLRGGEQPEATRMAKLQMIERYIDKYHHVGDIENPGREFFRGSMEMRWGWLSPRHCNRPQCNCFDYGWTQLCWDDEHVSPVVIFRGTRSREKAHDLVLLGGSRSHVLGAGAENDPAASLRGGSWMASLLDTLDRYVSQHRDFWARGKDLPGKEIRLAIEAGMLMSMKEPAQRLIFLAVPYGQDEIKTGTSLFGGSKKWMSKPLNGVIGTPVYVALEQAVGGPV